MTESSRENLSSLMDGELDRRGRKFLLRRLSGDADMKAAWGRMHTVRACLHRERLAGSDLVSRVADALAEEPMPGGRPAQRWLRPVAGGAIAASVALMAIVGINSSMLDQQGGAPAAEEASGFVSRSTSLDEPFTQSAVPVGYSEERRAERERISGYVLRHHQAAGSGGFPAWVPIVTGLDENAQADQAEQAIETPIFEER
ncbi:MAG: hypothetical protein GVY32_04515 [Gammaproteobacteria bacterium]|jgi:negative regulator of sigma E activity|nr:hypothetical protein [Gammaproteobacteria bacterium]